MTKELVKKKPKEHKKLEPVNKTDIIIFNIIVFVCFIMLAIAITPKEFQNDTFYTISCGSHLAKNGIFNQHMDPFSWHNLPYTFPHWLYDLMIFVIYTLAGDFWMQAIYVSTIVLAFILGLSLYKLTYKLSKNRILSFAFSLYGLYLMRPFVTARAQLVTYILFILEIYFVEKLLEENKFKYGIPLIGIAFLIAQMHCAVYPLFFVFLLPYLVEYLIAFIIEWDLDERIFIGIFNLIKLISKNPKTKEKYEEFVEKSRRNIESRKIVREKKKNVPTRISITKNPAMLKLIAVLVISVLVGALNPMGLNAYTYTIKTFMGNTMKSISEHLPTVLADNMDSVFIIASILALLILTNTKIRLSELFLFAGTTFMLILSSRHNAIFIIMCIPILVTLLSRFLEMHNNKISELALKLSTTIIGMCLVVGLVGYESYVIYKDHVGENYINEASYPVKATDFLLKYMAGNDISKDDLKLYNEYNYGSYLIFKGIRPFIDSRADLYSPEFNGRNDDIFTDALSVSDANENYVDIFEKYGVNYAMFENGKGVNIYLSQDEDYEEIYSDEYFVIYKKIK